VKNDYGGKRGLGKRVEGALADAHELVPKIGDPSETIVERLDRLRQLSRSQYKYVYYRSQGMSKVAALKLAGRTLAWLGQLPKEDEDALEVLALNLSTAGMEQAMIALNEAAMEAVQVKIAGLRHKSVWLQQAAASDILDRVGARKDKRVIKQVEGGTSNTLDIRVVYDD
jgi:hypothetical protein